jgi:hypothetical protein
MYECLSPLNILTYILPPSPIFHHHGRVLVVVMAQGLDTGLSTKPPGFDSRLNIRFFQITTIFRRRCKAVGPGYYLVVVVRLC